jgi:GWxTD domain-containing protein
MNVRESTGFDVERNPQERLLATRKKPLRSLFLVLAFLLQLFVQPFVHSQETEEIRQEESESYFDKWLKRDVVYIITPEEKQVFSNLATPEEKEQLIEQFWFRRDPDPRTAVNEFKEEHYRRIAFANERYTSGSPGWITDRGRVYIIHGPPDEIESHPSGGPYQRPMHEGGGRAQTYPFELWRYRHIEGLGSDIILEFVDPTMSGQYRLALMPEEKEALLHVGGSGQTLAEQYGFATRSEHPHFTPGNRGRYPLMPQRQQDTLFARYETYDQVQRPTPIKFTDLRKLVKVDVTYSELPATVEMHYFRLNERQVLVPISIKVANKDLTFEEEGELRVARLAVYGVITSITDKLIEEFEQDFMTTYRKEAIEAGLLEDSVCQKIIPLARKMRYKLTLVLKDQNSGHVGVIYQALVPPPHEGEKLIASSLVLADYMEDLQEVPEREEMFVLGNVKVRPRIGKEFSRQSPLGLYLQIYNAALDQVTFTPSLRVVYRLKNRSGVAQEVIDANGTSIQFVSSQRIVLTKQLSLESLPEGTYAIEVQVDDLIADQSVSVYEQLVIG